MNNTYFDCGAVSLFTDFTGKHQQYCSRVFFSYLATVNWLHRSRISCICGSRIQVCSFLLLFLYSVRTCRGTGEVHVYHRRWSLKEKKMITICNLPLRLLLRCVCASVVFCCCCCFHLNSFVRRFCPWNIYISVDMGEGRKSKDYPTASESRRKQYASADNEHVPMFMYVMNSKHLSETEMRRAWGKSTNSMCVIVSGRFYLIHWNFIAWICTRIWCCSGLLCLALFIWRYTRYKSAYTIIQLNIRTH